MSSIDKLIDNKLFVIIKGIEIDKNLYYTFEALECRLLEENIEINELEGEDRKSFNILVSRISANIMGSCNGVRDFLAAQEYINAFKSKIRVIKPSKCWTVKGVLINLENLNSFEDLEAIFANNNWYGELTKEEYNTIFIIRTNLSAKMINNCIDTKDFLRVKGYNDKWFEQQQKKLIKTISWNNKDGK